MILWSIAPRGNKNLVNNLKKTKQLVWSLFNVFILWLFQEFSAPLHVLFEPYVSRDRAEHCQILICENIDCFHISVCQILFISSFTLFYKWLYFSSHKPFISRLYYWRAENINQKYVAASFKFTHAFLNYLLFIYFIYL